MRLTIEASAGTGKTYELTTIVAAAVAGRAVFDETERGSGLIDRPEFVQAIGGDAIPSSALLLVTFTDTAMRELHHRVRSRLAGMAIRENARNPDSTAARRLTRALREIDTIAISTIHGFCARMLREHAFELGLPGAAPKVIDEAELATELAMRWWSERVRDDAPRERLLADAGVDLAALSDIVKASLGSRGVELARVNGGGVDALLDELMRAARAQVAEVLRLRGGMTYQDQLVLVLEGIRRSPRLAAAIRDRYRLAVIDEAQDTDPVQLEIFQRLFDDQGDPARLLILVGDPKQSIFGFRGADLDAYLRARGTQAPLRLSVNRRSCAGLVDAFNVLFAGERPFERPGIEHPPVQAAPVALHGRIEGLPACEVCFGAPGESPEQWAAATLQALHGGGWKVTRESGVEPLRWRDCAVLGSSNDALRGLDRMLRSAGIPTILLGDRSVFASETVTELRALLAACAEPGRAARVRRAMIGSLLAVPAAALTGTDEHTTVALWATRLASWSSASRRGGVLGIVESALEQSAQPVDARTATDALHLAELVNEQVGAGAAPSAMLAALDRLQALHEHAPTRPGDRLRRRIDAADAVILQTIHGSKGLQYGVVLLPWAGRSASGGSAPRVVRLPARRVAELGPEFEAPSTVDGDASVLALVPTGTTPPIIAERQREEALRLLYVGVTRAQHALRAFVKHSERAAPPSALELRGIRAEANPWPPSVPRAIAAETPDAGGATTPRDESARLAQEVAGHGHASERTIGRPLALWFDTSFTRLKDSAPEDAADRLGRPGERAFREDEPAPIVARDALGGGRELGRIVHRIFEWASLEGPRADLRSITVRAIAEAGGGARFDPALLATVADRTRSAELASVGGPSVPLGAFDPASIAVELQFHLPMGHARAFDPGALAAACAEAPAGSAIARFAPLAARLGFGATVGFLGGTIDLLASHEGRWWILDYKSNDLGDRDEDYRAERMAEEMIRQHYVLQYLLYVVAARRLLSLRGVDTSGAWLGGVIYPFVRGIDPREPGRGIFIDHPPSRVIDAVDALLRGPVSSPIGGAA